MDTCRRLFLPLLLFLVPATAVLAAQPSAQTGDENQAALVIRYGEEQVETFCVSFAEPEITGYELLQRAGREVVVNEIGMGVTVCRLDQVGCPASDCFCECQGASCEYWSYWHQQQGEWQYAVVGASTYMVEPGGVEGWSWGPGSVTEAIAPPPLSFADLCVAEVPAADADEAPTVGETTPAPAAELSSAVAPTSIAPTPVPAPAAVENTAGWLYALFALIVIGLVVFLWWLQRREGRT